MLALHNGKILLTDMDSRGKCISQSVTLDRKPQFESSCSNIVPSFRCSVPVKAFSWWWGSILIWQGSLRKRLRFVSGALAPQSSAGSCLRINIELPPHLQPRKGEVDKKQPFLMLASETILDQFFGIHNHQFEVSRIVNTAPLQTYHTYSAA